MIRTYHLILLILNVSKSYQNLCQSVHMWESWVQDVAEDQEDQWSYIREIREFHLSFG